MSITERERRTSRLRRLWAEHEEGVLYAVAVLVYVPLGVLLKAVVLNWIVGPLFPVLVVYVIPALVRRAWRRRLA
ncbi:MAG TPA: hypothetical protein VFO65_09465 [Acidimicrobiales bacterium]|nr:hypothetical protein [Acidimicrobiales bacterium]